MKNEFNSMSLGISGTMALTKLAKALVRATCATCAQS